MKGISAVIGALIILIITIALGSIAYTFITGTATRTIAIILEIDPSITVCDGSTNTITTGVKNLGASPISLSEITFSGTNSIGNSITSITCAATGILPAGGRIACTNTLTTGVTNGNNVIVVAGGGSAASGVIFCT